jgi:NADH-quinone oxidoreductase subunit L
MWRLMAMTFFGAYRGPAWETAHHSDVAVAAAHGVKHPADPHAHGQAHKDDHEVSHGPADAHDDHGAGHGHGPWHGPHESPAPMTFPLQALAIGAMIAGLIGIPAALGGPNTIEHFLEPAFTAEHVEAHGTAEGAQAAEAEHEAEPHVSRQVELGLMAFSVLVAVAGIFAAQKFYVKSPEISEQLAERFAGPHRLLSNKYYVDEVYDAAIVQPIHIVSEDGLWKGVDVGVIDRTVNGVASAVAGSGELLRRLQTGSVRAYAVSIFLGGVLILGYFLWL